MGAWGAGSFDNDDADDLVVRLESEGAGAIKAALEAVAGLGAQDYLEAPEASSAIAAAEVVAAAHDGDARQLPEEAERWLDQNRGSIKPRLLGLARRAVERVLTQSELKDLWEAGGANPEFAQWAEGVRRLLGRLEAKAPRAGKARAPGSSAQTRRQALKPGAVLRVDLDEGWHTYARILDPVPMVAFYDCRVSAPMDDLRAIAGRPVLFVLAVSGQAHKGHWPKVGDVPPDASPVPIPAQFMQDIATGQCQIVDKDVFNARPATPEECLGLERVAVWDPTHVEERLRDHYAGRPNAHLEYMKVKLPGRG